MNNYPYELYKLAKNYHYGWDGKKKDLKVATALYKKAAEAGYKPALDRLKELENDIKQRFDELLKIARSGSEEYMVEVGLAYELGKYGVTINKQEACNWYRMAARKGNAKAKYRLELLAKTCKLENADEIGKAFYEKGYSYEYGIGVKTDKTFAELMYEKAAAMGYEPAKDGLQRLNKNMSYEQLYHCKNSEEKSMRNSNNNQTKSSKVNYSKALTIYQEKPLVVIQETNVDVKQMLQVQLYLRIHPILKKDAESKMEYMALLENILKGFVQKDKWKKSLIELYQKAFINNLTAYERFKNKMILPKYYPIKSLLLTDSLFIGAFGDKTAGFKILAHIAKFRSNHDDLDEYIFKSFYSADMVLNFDKKFPDLFEIYRIIWNNRQFLKKPIKKIMLTANMSAGKSTLLNALTGKKVNKTQNDVCTAKRHYLFNKAGEDGFNYELDYDLELDATEEILMTDNENNLSEEICVGTRFFTLKELNQRICFIDTPGANSSLNEEHRDITEKVISTEKCDLLLYLLNAENIGTDDDLKLLTFVKDNYHGKIIFLVNKLDHFKKGVDSVEKTVDAVKKDVLKFGFKDIEVYPISAYAAYLAKRAVEGETLNDEENDELEYLIRKLNKEEFNYNKYYNLHIVETEFDKSNKIELQQLLLHSGIMSLEKLIYNN